MPQNGWKNQNPWTVSFKNTDLSILFWTEFRTLFQGGWFDDQYQEVYAKYLAKYLEAYKAEGLEIEFITPGNEPGHGAGG